MTNLCKDGCGRAARLRCKDCGEPVCSDCIIDSICYSCEVAWTDEEIQEMERAMENTLYAEDLKKILHIKTEMGKTAKGSGYDPEVAHSYADSLLVELIEVLSANHPNKNEIDVILEDYEDVDKWYA